MKPDIKAIQEQISKIIPGDYEYVNFDCMRIEIGPIKKSRGSMTSHGTVAIMEDHEVSDFSRKQLQDTGKFLAGAKKTVENLISYIEKLEPVAEAAQRLDFFEDFNKPIVSTEYDSTDHNAARSDLHVAVETLRAEGIHL